jgi:glycerophosphoryl diester phosphodiesterase
VADAANPFGPGPFGLAHRGGAAESAENSRTAFQHAVDLGFRWIETDVRATRDGHAVVFHDATLDRTTNASGPLGARMLSELSAVRLTDDQPPLTLVEALRTWPDTAFNVDVKSVEAIGPFLRAVASEDAWDRVCAASFSARRLRLLRRAAGSRLATSLGSAEAVQLVLGGHPRVGACAAQIPATIRGRELVSAGLLARARECGLQIHVWTVNDEAQMRRLLDLGVDGIVTDRPSVLARVLLPPQPAAAV